MYELKELLTAGWCAFCLGVGLGWFLGARDTLKIVERELRKGIDK